eukprot:1827116-Amphidinium_carterae.1
MSLRLSHAEWAMEWWKLAVDCNYDLRQRVQNAHQIDVRPVVKKNVEIPKLLAVTDAKSLFDTVNKESYSHTERRAALEVAVIRDSLNILSGQIRWIPHSMNAAYCLTKLGANAQAMIALLASGWLQLKSEDGILEERRQYREDTGKACPRPHRRL